MAKPILTLTPQEARRLAITAQRLSGAQPEATAEAMLDILRTIRCLQMDPIRAVERTQYLVLWSRLGNYDREQLHQLIYEDGHLFEYWAHAASLVLTEDYPLHSHLMRRYGKSGSSGAQRLTHWVKENRKFRNYILQELRERGPLRTQDFEDDAKVPWASGGWTSGRSVAYMLDYLWTKGEVLVARRKGLQRWWDLAERVLPPWTPTHRWSATQVTRDAAQKSLKALGIAQTRDIERHFTERRYPQLNKVLPSLRRQGLVLDATVTGWPGDWLLHADQLPLLEVIRAGDWQPRTTLLSPFDNLIRDRDRTELMWDFFYRIEIYVPQAKRQYGYYVLPILQGDALIGRIDPRMDWKQKVLTINAIYPEAEAPAGPVTGRAVITAIEALAQFLGATRIDYGAALPTVWQTV
ncbi:MAG: crosslink repair DNA glycosylase YcaQ family protein [Caldilineaceae bacterium]